MCATQQPRLQGTHIELLLYIIINIRIDIWITKREHLPEYANTLYTNNNEITERRILVQSNAYPKI